MSWIEFLKSISDDFVFTKGVTDQALAETESILGFSISSELHDLLKETNGVESKSAHLLFILSIERIKQDNLEMRNSQSMDLYMPFDDFLFFADCGNGDKFGFPIVKNGRIRKDVFMWNHEDDSRSWCAPTLRTFIQWWNDGKIKCY
jgi:hypothetical protein